MLHFFGIIVSLFFNWICHRSNVTPLLHSWTHYFQWLTSHHYGFSRVEQSGTRSLACCLVSLLTSKSLNRSSECTTNHVVSERVLKVTPKDADSSFYGLKVYGLSVKSHNRHEFLVISTWSSHLEWCVASIQASDKLSWFGTNISNKK